MCALQVDRWTVVVEPKPHGTTAFGRALAGETHGTTVWMNYLSVGVDAKIVADFEWCRTNYKSLFCGQVHTSQT